MKFNREQIITIACLRDKKTAYLSSRYPKYPEIMSMIIETVGKLTLLHKKISGY